MSGRGKCSRRWLVGWLFGWLVLKVLLFLSRFVPLIFFWNCPMPLTSNILGPLVPLPFLLPQLWVSSLRPCGNFSMPYITENTRPSSTSVHAHQRLTRPAPDVCGPEASLQLEASHGLTGFFFVLCVCACVCVCVCVRKTGPKLTSVASLLLFVWSRLSLS